MNNLIDVKVNDLSYTVRVNDWLIAQGDGKPRSLFTQLTNIQVDGENKVSARVALPPGVPVASKFAEARVRVRNAEGSLYTFAWRGDNPLPALPIQTAGAFASATRHGLWSWQRGARVTLDGAARQGIMALVTQAYEALNRRDTDATVHIFATRDRERAIAQEGPVEQEIALARADYAASFADPAWAMQPLRAEQFLYTLMADGRVVLATAADGRDPLRSAPDSRGGITGFSVYASLVDGKWIIVH